MSQPRPALDENRPLRVLVCTTDDYRRASLNTKLHALRQFHLRFSRDLLDWPSYGANPDVDLVMLDPDQLDALLGLVATRSLRIGGLLCLQPPNPRQCHWRDRLLVRTGALDLGTLSHEGSLAARQQSLADHLERLQPQRVTGAPRLSLVCCQEQPAL